MAVNVWLGVFRYLHPSVFLLRQHRAVELVLQHPHLIPHLAAVLARALPLYLERYGNDGTVTAMTLVVEEVVDDDEMVFDLLFWLSHIQLAVYDHEWSPAITQNLEDWEYNWSVED